MGSLRDLKWSTPTVSRRYRSITAYGMMKGARRNYYPDQRPGRTPAGAVRPAVFNFSNVYARYRSAREGIRKTSTTDRYNACHRDCRHASVICRLDIGRGHRRSRLYNFTRSVRTNVRRLLALRTDNSAFRAPGRIGSLDRATT